MILGDNMKKLSELYPGVSEDVTIKAIKINSKECEPGDLFVCTMGVTADRHEFIGDAISHGASAVVVSRDVGDIGVPVVKVPDTNRELPYLCQKFYDYPDQKLKVLGITGTDGKTSTATIMQTLIGNDLCGYIGTMVEAVLNLQAIILIPLQMFICFMLILKNFWIVGVSMWQWKQVVKLSLEIDFRLYNLI